MNNLDQSAGSSSKHQTTLSNGNHSGFLNQNMKTTTSRERLLANESKSLLLLNAPQSKQTLQSET